ncbi:MAG: 30S ribosomal protein S6 [Planctomycetes bacterium]|nr:30S ribosomal protein S6 [Planctomycetota bacterium]
MSKKEETKDIEQTSRQRFYEGMFLVDSSWANKQADEVVAAITEMVDRYNGSRIRLEKWEERNLAYSIKIERTVHKRGVYYLSALKLEPSSINKIYHEIKLNTSFIRAQFLQKREDEIDKIFLQFPTLEQWRRIITKDVDYFDQVKKLFQEKKKEEAKQKAEVEVEAQKIIEERKKGIIISSFDEEKDFEDMRKKKSEDSEKSKAADAKKAKASDTKKAKAADTKKSKAADTKKTKAADTKKTKLEKDNDTEKK